MFFEKMLLEPSKDVINCLWVVNPSIFGSPLQQNAFSMSFKTKQYLTGVKDRSLWPSSGAKFVRQLTGSRTRTSGPRGPLTGGRPAAALALELITSISWAWVHYPRKKRGHSHGDWHVSAGQHEGSESDCSCNGQSWWWWFNNFYHNKCVQSVQPILIFKNQGHKVSLFMCNVLQREDQKAKNTGWWSRPQF